MSVLVKSLSHTFSSTQFWCFWVVVGFELELTLLMPESTLPLEQIPLHSPQYPLIFQWDLFMENDVYLWHICKFPHKVMEHVVLQLLDMDHCGFVCRLHTEALSCVVWYWQGIKLSNQYEDLNFNWNLHPEILGCRSFLESTVTFSLVCLLSSGSPCSHVFLWLLMYFFFSVNRKVHESE
jgi:hypothetical protein